MYFTPLLKHVNDHKCFKPEYCNLQLTLNLRFKKLYFNTSFKNNLIVVVFMLKEWVVSNFLPWLRLLNFFPWLRLQTPQKFSLTPDTLNFFLTPNSNSSKNDLAPESDSTALPQVTQNCFSSNYVKCFSVTHCVTWGT